MIRSFLKTQRGGVAVLTALGFLVFSVPLITGSLGLAQTTSIDARVKTQVTYADYCKLAVVEFFDYLLEDVTRFEAWMTANGDPLDPGTSIGSLDLVGVDCGIVVTSLPPEIDNDPLDDNPPIIIPFAGPYKQRDFQTFKTASPTNPTTGSSVFYEIEIINRSADTVTLNEIRDTLPEWFSYDCAGSSTLTLPGASPEVIFPSPACPTGRDISWSMAAGTSVLSGELVRLGFSAKTSNTTGSAPVGVFCNELQVVPGGDKTRSGQTARVKIGDPGTDQCPGEAVKISQKLKNLALQLDGDGNPVIPYAIDIGYTIKVENIGTTDLIISQIIDLLPKGSEYVENTCDVVADPNCITDTPFQVQWTTQDERWRVTWKFNPGIPIAPGEIATLDFSTEALSNPGNYWVDLLVSFDGAFPEKVYTWPTAVVAVKEHKTVAITINGVVVQEEALELLIQAGGGEIKTWTIY